jgi:hypothetical protein
MEQRKKDFLATLASGATVKASAEAAGAPSSTIYLWRDSDPEFAAAWRHAYERDGRDALVEEARRRALAGSDILLIFLLKQRDPSFRDKHVEVSGPGGGPVEVASWEIPPARLAAAAAILRSAGAGELTAGDPAPDAT